MIRKKKIYYARTYRRLNKGGIKELAITCCLICFALLLFIVNLKKITFFMSWLAAELLGKEFPGLRVQIVESEFSFISQINLVEMPTVYPDTLHILINIIVLLLLILFACTGGRKGKPLSIFLLIVMVIHMINCIYFLFAENYFPYSVYQYSDLYMKQQIGIWLVFIILSGCTIGFMGRKGLLYKAATFLGTILYSLAFGIIRYVLFLYLLEKFSILYMAMMFFVLGPFFDFLYLVGIYALFINKMVSIYDSSEKGREEWMWS